MFAGATFALKLGFRRRRALVYDVLAAIAPMGGRYGEPKRH
jgi:hypothetical protein